MTLALSRVPHKLEPGSLCREAEDCSGLRYVCGQFARVCATQLAAELMIALTDFASVFMDAR